MSSKHLTLQEVLYLPINPGKKSFFLYNSNHLEIAIPRTWDSPILLRTCILWLITDPAWEIKTSCLAACLGLDFVEAMKKENLLVSHELTDSPFVNQVLTKIIPQAHTQWERTSQLLNLPWTTVFRKNSLSITILLRNNSATSHKMLTIKTRRRFANLAFPAGPTKNGKAKPEILLLLLPMLLLHQTTSQTSLIVTRTRTTSRMVSSAILIHQPVHQSYPLRSYVDMPSDSLIMIAKSILAQFLVSLKCFGRATTLPITPLVHHQSSDLANPQLTLDVCFKYLIV